MSLGDRIRQVDPVLFGCTLGLSALSLLTLWGGRDAFGTRTLIMQLAMTVLGNLLVFFVANMDYQEIVEKFYIAMFLISVGFLAVVLLFGESVGENKSWLTLIRFGGTEIGIQPSEFVKATFIVSFSKHLDLVKDRINAWKSVIGLAIHAGIIVGLILISGDLGVALVYMGIVAVMLYWAGLSPWYFVGALALLVIAAPFLWEHLETYQQERILCGFNPELDPLGKGRQPILCRSAIANGGWFGRGINGGTIYKTLPVASSDCFFATYCEKFGLAGAILMIGLYVVLIFRVVQIGRSARKSYGAYICAGVLGMLIVQVVENVGMCLCMLPVIGITLPFMSAGGSSVLATYIIFGMVHSVRARRVKYYSERMG
ncbi:MAG: FtsW/RodA/SpoVE family cell cycle protein [Clostridia bacterium]|nr:FtsW/RodA/SpoVE family cell cycle protein [Clostridia bacterium]